MKKLFIGILTLTSVPSFAMSEKVMVQVNKNALDGMLWSNSVSTDAASYHYVDVKAGATDATLNLHCGDSDSGSAGIYGKEFYMNVKIEGGCKSLRAAILDASANPVSITVDVTKKVVDSFERAKASGLMK